ncbi:MAG: alpha/beta hydrolase [Actinomycetota bacterium]
MRVTVDGNQTHAATGGVSIHGDGATERPVALLVHGAGMDGTVWQYQTRYLAHRGLRAVAVDLPGHGRSGGEPLTSIVDMADWTARFVTAAGLDDRPGGVHVVGHSMGTFIGLELAARHPALVRSLVLLGTADAMPVHPELLSSSADALDRAAALMAAWSHGRGAHVGLHPTPGLWMLGGARALVENGRPGALTVDFQACADYRGARDAAAAVACQTTVVVGAEDKMTPAKAAARLAEALPAAALTMTTLAGVGHSMMIEDPRAVRELVVDAVRAAEAEPVLDITAPVDATGGAVASPATDAG